MIARLAVAAALLGSAAGATAVLAADDEPPKRAPRPPAVRVATPTPQPTPEPLKARDVKLARQVPDPEGGAPWVVRTFTASIGAKTFTCWELGRVQGDRVGWIDGHGAFTAHEPGIYALPMPCATPEQLDRAKVKILRVTLVSYSPGRAPQPARTITWGPAAPDVTALAPADQPRIEIPADRLVLQVQAGEAPGLRKGTIELSDGTSKAFDYSGDAPPRAGAESPVEGTQRVAATAPDPAGGEPWGIVVQRGDKGGLCFDIPDRIVGTQVGFIDRRLDLFYSVAGFRVACGRLVPTRKDPLQMDTLISGGGPQGEDRGRIERRVLEGRIVYWGRVHPDVVSVTIKTPRDVRTLIPSKDFHMIVAVYDGLFPGGKATATAHVRNGKEVTRALHVE